MVEVIVEYDYTSHEDDELTIKQGDIIKDVVKMEGGWWEGLLNGKRGMFPDNFVKEIKKEKTTVPANKKSGGSHVTNLAKNLGPGGIKMGPPPAAVKVETKPDKKKVFAKVTYDYTPKHEDEIALTIGDVIEVTKQEEEGWWEGIKNGAAGLFPSNFVELVRDDTVNEAEKEGEVHEIKGKKVKGVGLGNIFGDGPIKLKTTNRSESRDNMKTEPKSEPRKDLPPDSKLKKGSSVTTATKEPPALPPKEIKEPKILERAKVLYSYKAENIDELSLEEGDIITVLEKELEDSGWWKGELNGKIGVFPDNFVELLRPEEVKPKKPPPPSVPKESPTKSDPPQPLRRDDLKEERAALGRKPAQPPPVSKKPLKHDEAKLIAQTDDMKAKEMDTDKAADNTFGDTEPGIKLSHLTAGRAKAPERRPPKNKPRTSKQDDPTSPESHHHQPSAPNTLPQQKRVNPLQASEHPIPVRTSPALLTTVKDEEVTPPVIKEREEKKVAPVRATRPPPPTPGKENGSPAVSPRSPDVDKTVVTVSSDAVAALKRELEETKASAVSRADYDALQQDLQHMREDMDKMRSQFHKKMLDLMKEVDDEKKIRLNMQVEMDRIKKLVFPDDD